MVVVSVHSSTLIGGASDAPSGVRRVCFHITADVFQALDIFKVPFIQFF